MHVYITSTSIIPFQRAFQVPFHNQNGRPWSAKGPAASLRFLTGQLAFGPQGCKGLLIREYGAGMHSLSIQQGDVDRLVGFSGIHKTYLCLYIYMYMYHVSYKSHIRSIYFRMAVPCLKGSQVRNGQEKDGHLCQGPQTSYGPV